MLRIIGARTPEVLVEAIGEALDAVSARDAEGFFTHSLVVRLVGGHVVGDDPVVDAAARTPHGRNYVVAGDKAAHVGSDLQHTPERLVACH